MRRNGAWWRRGTAAREVVSSSLADLDSSPLGTVLKWSTDSLGHADSEVTWMLTLMGGRAWLPETDVGERRLSVSSPESPLLRGTVSCPRQPSDPNVFLLHHRPRAMESYRRSLSSLPEDVLDKILAHLLVDTPRAPHHAAILQTCSALHSLGQPLLYRTVVFDGYRTTRDLVAAMGALFGREGPFWGDGELKKVARRSVVELRIGRPDTYTAVSDPHGRPSQPRARFKDRSSVLTSIFRLSTSTAVELSAVDLPRCTSLVLDGTPFGLFSVPPAFTTFITRLPINRFTYHAQDIFHSKGCQPAPRPVAVSFSTSLSRSLLGTANPGWASLETVRFTGALAYDAEPPKGRYAATAGEDVFVSRIACWEWAVKTLVVDLTDVPETQPLQRDRDQDKENGRWDRLVRLFLKSMEMEQVDGWWGGLERIELRVPPAVETELRFRLAEARKSAPLVRLQRRILPLVVFVGADGHERKSMEDG